jgi:hypothetical protein
MEIRGAEQVVRHEGIWIAILTILIFLLLALGVGGQQLPRIVKVEADPSGSEVRLLIQGSGEPGEVLEVFHRDWGSGFGCGQTSWRLAASDVRAGDWPQSQGWVTLPQGGESSAFFTIGRADLDLNENGIADAREKLLQVQDLPSTLRARGARAGRTGDFTNYASVVDVKSFGAKGNGTTDDTMPIVNAINSLSGYGVIYLPAGTYRITQPLYLKANTILRGAGSTLTRLHFEGSGTAGRCIGAVRWDSNQTDPWRTVTGGMEQGSCEIELSSVSGIVAGDIIEIEQEKDPAWNLNESWQANLQGQIVRVAGVNGAAKTVLLERPLRIGYSIARNPRARKLATIGNVGIEDLYIERKDAVNGYTIELKYAVNCWVRRVESYRTYKSHVWIERGYENEVRENYFHHSHVYGGGGEGYGVACGRHTSDTLVEDNVFDTLRHSMSVGHGANGNVFAYNFSTNRALDPVLRTPQADISVHGNWVYMNLFEGNVVEDADVPDWYFPAGPGNTLFRNRIVNRSVAVEVGSDDQNIVGNELPAGCVRVDNGVMDAIVHGNCEGGTVTWEPEMCRNLPPSYFRSTRPNFIPVDDPQIQWPPLGSDLGSGSRTIPAERRYAAGQCVPGM